MAGLAKRTIGHLSFPYTRVRQVDGQERRSRAYAMRGESVELLPEDVERGERLGAFDQPPPIPTDSEALEAALEAARAGADPWVPSPAVPQEAHLLPEGTEALASGEMPSVDDDDLAAFVEEANADDVIDRAGDDPDVAARLLEAEQAQEKPRKTVVEALEKVTER